jgi:hypothetical protein
MRPCKLNKIDPALIDFFTIGKLEKSDLGGNRL